MDMDFVKREEQNAMEDEYNKVYMDTIQKTHQLDATEYHSQLSMEQLHQAMQSTVANSLVHNFQLPLSPRQMSTLMLKSNHLSRSLNFNDIPAHLTRNLELDLAHNLINEVPQQRHDDIMGQTRNDISLRGLSHDMELQGNLSQLAQTLTEHDLNRLNELRSDMANDLSQLDLSHHLIVDERRDGMLDPSLGQRLVPGVSMIENKIEAEHLLPMPFHIKSEQDDDGYFYSQNINQPISNVSDISGLPEQTHQPNIANEQIHYVYNPVTAPVPALNPIDLYSRPQNFVQNFTNIRENPQNLVVHRQYNENPYEEFKKVRQDGGIGAKESKMEDPKENLKPEQNKIYYMEYQTFDSKNENDSGVQNKIEDINMSIKGQYGCYKCNETFPSKRGLKQHSKNCVDTETCVEKLGKFSCTQCAYRCQSPAILKIHERTHSGEKPFSCTFCDYKSGQKNNVAKHILVHMKEKPFRCQYCDYRCAQKNNLVVHERTHTGYKPFACPYCDYRTVQKPNLVKHMYLHTDQKPFSCDMCSYRCVQKTNLTKHKQRHLNEKEGEKVEVKNQIKPYRPRQKSVKCPHCAYRCVQKASMEKHLQFKHPEDQGLNLMKGVESGIQDLCVKKDVPCDKMSDLCPES